MVITCRPCSFSTFRLNLVLTRGIPPDFRGGVNVLIPPYAIGLVPGVHRVTQLLTHGIHCRESAGTVPIIALKAIPVTSAAFAVITTI